MHTEDMILKSLGLSVVSVIQWERSTEARIGARRRKRRREGGDPSERKAFSNFPRDVAFTVGTSLSFTNIRGIEEMCCLNSLFRFVSGDWFISRIGVGSKVVQSDPSWRWSSTGAGRAGEAASSTAPTAPRDGLARKWRLFY